MDQQGSVRTGATGDSPDIAGQEKPVGQPEENVNDKDSLQAKSGSTIGDAHGAPAVDSAPVDLTRPTDEQILSYENQIKDEQRQKRPLLGDKEQTESLRGEYQDSSPIFVAKVEHLCSAYTFLRRTRQDGNCFYRAFLYGLLEALLTSRAVDATNAMLKLLISLKQMLLDAGFMELVFEHAMEVLEDLLKAVANTQDRMEAGELLVRLCDEGVCNELVMLVRFVASAHVARRSDHFLPFVIGMVDGCAGVDDFRRRHVEAMGEESDHIQVVAVAEAFQVPVMVVYLDNSHGTVEPDGKMPCNTHLFEPLEPIAGVHVPQVTVLYRPGHYDILYK